MPKSPQKPSLDCYLVFSPAGELCRAHVGADAEFAADSHASVLKGFVVRAPITHDYRDYQG